MDLKKIMFFIVIILNGIILFFACKKEKTEEPDYDTYASSDNSLAEGIFNDVNNIANQAIDNDSLTTYKLSNPANSILSTCATVTNTPDSSGGGNIVVNFGPTNCLCRDNRYRRGSINFAYTGHYRDSGTVITATFSNYFTGLDTTTRMFQVTGTKTITNNGHNSSGNLNYSINVNGHLINSGNGNMDWTSTRNREWIAGENTLLNWLDDEYIITGSASGTNFEGTSFTVTITHGLHVALNCPFIIEGTFELIPSGKATRIFDYGNGTCDANATLTINSTTFPIVLR